MACESSRVQWPFRAVLRALARAVGPSGPILPAIRRLWIALCSDLSLIYDSVCVCVCVLQWFLVHLLKTLRSIRSKVEWVLNRD